MDQSHTALPADFTAPHRQVWAIAGPAILANSSAPLVGLVDTWAIGHLPSPVHLAAVGLGSVIFSYMLWAFGFLRMGTLNLTRFHGLFAPNCKHRHQVVPRRPWGRMNSDKPLAPMSWAQRLKRVFAIDIERCPDCGGKLRVIACIEDPRLIAKILARVRAHEVATVKAMAQAPPTDNEARLRLN